MRSDPLLMHARANKAKSFRQMMWLVFTVSLALWVYLRLHLGLPAPVDALVLIALRAEAALVLGHHPARRF